MGASLSEEAAERYFTAIHAALDAGWPPPGKTRGKKGAIAVACESLGINVSSGRSHLIAATATLGREPDWSRWKEPVQPQSAIPPVPDGYFIKGTSTLYDPQTGEAKLEWVKTGIDQERQKQLFQEMVDAMASKLPRVKSISGPRHTTDALMACYPIGDHHLGMLAWGEETGQDYDLDIAERVLMGAMDHLVKAAPSCDRAAVVFLGDYLHYDSFVAETPTSRNTLDSDTRFPKMVRAAIRSMRHTIDAALRHHGEVLVVIEPGNHDLASSVWLREGMAALYESEPRAKVDTSPRHFHYFDFGKNLVGTHHGHGPKMDKLPLIMATDKPDLWGRTTYRYIWTGHVHHDQVKDYEGCRVESFRILAPTDAWAANSGYRSQSDMKAIVLHRDHGEVSRHIVNPRMLEAT